MNPLGLNATDLMLWGLVAHLVADWPLQSDWMAQNKARRRSWWRRHPAAWVHAGIHGLLLAPLFGWVAAILALAHLVIDCRWIVERWSKLVGQTQPQGLQIHPVEYRPRVVTLYDVGTEVRFWVDQVFHVICIAIAALTVGALL